MKKRKEPNTIPFRITKKPLDTTKEKLKDVLYIKVNDLFFVRNTVSPKFIFLYIGLACLILYLVFFIPLSNEELFSAGGIIFTFLWISLSILLIVFDIRRDKEKKMILERLTGLITLPGNLQKKEDEILEFNTGEAYTVLYNSSPGVFHETLMYRNKKTKRQQTLSDHYLEETWSFYVWYMDKNRPLPPGDAFDPYRQKDYERRKAEGFPKPLYPSSIPTPEATAAQQAERKRIGGW